MEVKHQMLVLESKIAHALKIVDYNVSFFTLSECSKSFHPEKEPAWAKFTKQGHENVIFIRSRNIETARVTCVASYDDLFGRNIYET